MQLDILTPDQSVFSGEVDTATLPGASGSFQILNSHAPLISVLEKGNLVYVNGGNSTTISILGGTVEVKDNKIIVLADGIEK